MKNAEDTKINSSMSLLNSPVLCLKCDKSIASVEKDDLNDSSSKLSAWFWKKLETDFKVSIPNYIKNILGSQNLDNHHAFRHITQDMIDELEKFAANDLKSVLAVDVDLKNYYGMFYKSPEKFKFMIGDRALLTELVKYVQSAKPQNWKKVEKKIQSVEPARAWRENPSFQDASSVNIEIQFETEKKKVADNNPCICST